MYSVNGNCFRISVRNLVEFMCAEGDIDNRNTGSNDVKIMQEGARIHRKIQHSMGTVLLQILIMTRMAIKSRRAMQ